MTMEELMEVAALKLTDEVTKGHDGAAVVWFDSTVDGNFTAMSDLTYWASEQTRKAFERRAARRAVENKWTRWAFATRMIIADLPDELLMREPNPNLPARDRVEGEDYGEIEIIWLIGCDLNEGLTVGRVDFSYDGEDVNLGHLLTMRGEHRLVDGAPGFDVVKIAAESGV